MTFTDKEYCNATISGTTSQYVDPYPFRLDCKINDDYMILRKTTSIPDFIPAHQTFKLIVYFKFKIDDQIPPAGIPPGISDPINVYGCVEYAGEDCDDPTNPLEDFKHLHVSCASTTFEVSGTL